MKPQFFFREKYHLIKEECPLSIPTKPPTSNQVSKTGIISCWGVFGRWWLSLCGIWCWSLGTRSHLGADCRHLVQDLFPERAHDFIKSVLSIQMHLDNKRRTKIKIWTKIKCSYCSNFLSIAKHNIMRVFNQSPKVSVRKPEPERTLYLLRLPQGDRDGPGCSKGFSS